jgi:6-phosphogluconolactonase/glucosamine-6-phosphate isomerase/deaminase
MDQFVGRIEVLADPPASARRLAEWMTATASAAKGRFRVALSGGSTPKALYSLLASEEFRDRFPWRQVSWFWGDERFVPYDHPESNYRMAREAMLAKVPVPLENIFSIPTRLELHSTGLRSSRSPCSVIRHPWLTDSKRASDIAIRMSTSKSRSRRSRQ